MGRFENLDNTRVLVVDDQNEIHDDFREMLAGRGKLSSDDLAPTFGTPSGGSSVLPDIELLHAANGEEGCKTVETARDRGQPIAVVYVDVRMPPGIGGIEAVHRMRAADRDVEIVLMTAYTDEPLSAIIDDMELLHKLLYIRKPFAREEIQQITLSLVVKWNVEQEVAAGRRQLTDSHRRLQAVLDATGDAVAMYDLDARLVFANRYYEQLFDIPASELRAMPRDAALALYTERLGDPRPGVAAREASNGNGSVVEPSGPDAGRKLRKPLFHRSTRSVSDGDGAVIGDLVVYRDVSREIEIEQMKLKVQRLRADLETTYSVGGIIGASAAIRKMCALVKQVADSDVSVLVQGESGTGKELVAKALHFSGARRQGPFRALNCAAMPETLIESELFGHERGAFTGAISRKIGCFEEADGGTLLLDEIGDMPSALQPKLLRVLQEREIRRVGGKTTIPVDVRIVAATNRDLEAAMREGAFREDLFYRLAVFPIQVPPLRTRQEDIPLLADHFLKKYAARLGKPLRGIAAGAVRALAQHAWPGNVRELENAIHRAVVVETTDVLQAASLPAELTPALGRGEPSPPVAAVATLAEVESQAIAAALDQAGGNRKLAAQALGISRATLHRKLKKHDQPFRD